MALSRHISIEAQLHITRCLWLRCFAPSSKLPYRATSQTPKPLDEMGILDTSLKLMGKFCLHPKFVPKKKVAEKEFCFSSCFAQKRGGRLRAQATKDTKWLKSEHRDCWVGEEKIRLLCSTEAFNYLD